MVVCPGGEETRPTGSSVLSLLIQDSVLTLLLSCLCAKKRPVRLWGEETPLVTTLVRFSNRLLLSYGDFIWETLCSLLQGGSTIVSFYVFCTVHTYPFIASWSVKKQSPMLWVLSLFVWPLSFNFLLLLISKETVTNVVKEARPIGQYAFPPSARLSRQSENSSCVQVSWPLDDHLQEAGPSGLSFARGRPLRIIICKRLAPPDDNQKGRKMHFETLHNEINYLLRIKESNPNG